MKKLQMKEITAFEVFGGLAMGGKSPDLEGFSFGC